MLSEQEQIRRKNREDLLEMGIDPYPAPLFPVNNQIKNILTKYKKNSSDDEFRDVIVAGRIMSRRIMVLISEILSTTSMQGLKKMKMKQNHMRMSDI